VSGAHGWYGLHRQFGRLGAGPSEGNHVGDYLAATLITVTPLLVLPGLRAGAGLRGAAAIVTATVGLAAARLLLAGAGLWLAVQRGAPALLLALLGFLAVRTAVTRRVRGGLA